MKLNDYIKHLDTGDYGYCLAEYDSGEICTIIPNIPDNLNLLDSDFVTLCDWLKDGGWYWFEDAVANYDICLSSPFDMLHAIQTAQARMIEQNIWDHLLESIRYCVFSNLTKDFDSLPEDTIERIEQDIRMDEYSRIEDLIEQATELIRESQIWICGPCADPYSDNAREHPGSGFGVEYRLEYEDGTWTCPHCGCTTSSPIDDGCYMIEGRD